eukprot:scaffold344398_cov15-Prasinocladus_malaysianus.AAC.1
MSTQLIKALKNVWGGWVLGCLSCQQASPVLSDAIKAPRHADDVWFRLVAPPARAAATHAKITVHHLIAILKRDLMSLFDN